MDAAEEKTKSVPDKVARKESQVDYRSEFANAGWSTGTRLAVGTAGLLAVIYGLRRKDDVGFAIGLGGLWGVIRASSNIGTAELLAYVTHPVIRIHRQVKVNVPLDWVYGFWSQFSNFVLFMSYVREVEVNDRGNTTWTVVGPGNVPIRWETAFHELVPGRSIAWRTLPGAAVSNSGFVHFSEADEGQSTWVDVHLSYAPPAGLLGYGMVRLLGFDPRDSIDDDLVKMKRLVETSFRKAFVRRTPA